MTSTDVSLDADAVELARLIQELLARDGHVAEAVKRMLLRSAPTPSLEAYRGLAQIGWVVMKSLSVEPSNQGGK